MIRYISEDSHDDVAEDEVTQEVVDEKQTDLDQPVVFRSSVHNLSLIHIFYLLHLEKCYICEPLTISNHFYKVDQPSPGVGLR